MNPLSILKSLLQTLQGEGDPRHVAVGFALGAAWGLVPKGNLFSAAFILLFFFFRADKTAALISAAVFTGVGHLLDGTAHSIGFFLLVSATGIKPFWTWLYNIPVIPWTKFNNTVVMGDLALGLVFYAPLYFIAMRVLRYYREHWAATVAQTPLIKVVNGMSFVVKYRDWMRI